MPKVDLDKIEQNNRTGYPAPFDQEVAGRWVRRLGPAVGLTDFGASDVTLEPGAWSSQRHWHVAEDELVIMLEGEAVLVEDNAETILHPGDIATFLKNVPNGHHLVNRSDRRCRFVAIGRPAADDCYYSDVDLLVDGATMKFTHKDRTPY